MTIKFNFKPTTWQQQLANPFAKNHPEAAAYEDRYAEQTAQSIIDTTAEILSSEPVPAAQGNSILTRAAKDVSDAPRSSIMERAALLAGGSMMGCDAGDSTINLIVMAWCVGVIAFCFKETFERKPVTMKGLVWPIYLPVRLVDTALGQFKVIRMRRRAERIDYMLWSPVQNYHLNKVAENLDHRLPFVRKAALKNVVMAVENNKDWMPDATATVAGCLNKMIGLWNDPDEGVATAALEAVPLLVKHVPRAINFSPMIQAARDASEGDAFSKMRAIHMRRVIYDLMHHFAEKHLFDLHEMDFILDGVEGGNDAAFEAAHAAAEHVDAFNVPAARRSIVERALKLEEDDESHVTIADRMAEVFGKLAVPRENVGESMEALISGGDEGGTIRDLLLHEGWKQRYTGVRLFGAMIKHSDVDVWSSHLPLLVSRTTDEHPEVRAAAVYALGTAVAQTSDGAARKAMVERLGDTNPKVRAASAVRIIELAHDGDTNGVVLGKAVDLLADGDKSVRDHVRSAVVRKLEHFNREGYRVIMDKLAELRMNGSEYVLLSILETVAGIEDGDIVSREVLVGSFQSLVKLASQDGTVAGVEGVTVEGFLAMVMPALKDMPEFLEVVRESVRETFQERGESVPLIYARLFR